MKDFLKNRPPANVANLIMLRRQVFQGCFILVEGRDDHLFFKKFINVVTCEILVAESKEKVINTIQILESRNDSGVLGVVDADFDRIVGRQRSTQNLILMETHDLDTFLIRSPALDQVLIEFGSQEKMRKFGSVRRRLLDVAIEIGCLRLHSLNSGLNLKFENLGYHVFIDKTSLSIDVPSLAKQVLNRPRSYKITMGDLVSAISVIKLTRPDPWDICQGDDLVSILALALQKVLGSRKPTEMSKKRLRGSLRLAYCQDHFDNSQLKVEIRDWENRNPDFQVLK